MRVKYVARLKKRVPDGKHDNVVLMLSAKGTDPERCDEQILTLLKFKYPDYEATTLRRVKIDGDAVEGED